MFPAGSEWNRDVSAEAADPHSADYLAFMGSGSLYLHPDFGGSYGQPFAVVQAQQTRVSMTFRYVSQSDPGPYPFPQDLAIQAEADRHQHRERNEELQQGGADEQAPHRIGQAQNPRRRQCGH